MTADLPPEELLPVPAEAWCEWIGLRVGPAVDELGITSGGGCAPRPLPAGPNVGG